MMNKKEIFRKIGGIISELTEQYQYLSENFDDLNDLELELFTANSKFLTDHAEILKKLNTKTSGSSQQTEAPLQQEPIPAPEAAPAEEIPVHSERPDTAAHEVETVETLEEETAEPEASEDIDGHSGGDQAEEPLVEEEAAEPANAAETPAAAQEQEEENEEEQQAEVKQPAAEEQHDESVQEVIIPEKTISVEIPQPAPRPTLNDLISARQNQAAAAGVNRPQQIKDLKSAISLNDKLSFIKELFNGYSLAYSEAIEILNRFETFDAADAFLKTNYAEKNNWAAKEPIVEKLYELLRNRYSL